MNERPYDDIGFDDSILEDNGGTDTLAQDFEDGNDLEERREVGRRRVGAIGIEMESAGFRPESSFTAPIWIISKISLSPTSR